MLSLYRPWSILALALLTTADGAEEPKTPGAFPALKSYLELFRPSAKPTPEDVEQRKVQVQAEVRAATLRMLQGTIALPDLGIEYSEELEDFCSVDHTPRQLNGEEAAMAECLRLVLGADLAKGAVDPIFKELFNQVLASPATRQKGEHALLAILDVLHEEHKASMEKSEVKLRNTSPERREELTKERDRAVARMKFLMEKVVERREDLGFETLWWSLFRTSAFRELERNGWPRYEGLQLSFLVAQAVLERNNRSPGFVSDARKLATIRDLVKVQEQELKRLKSRRQDDLPSRSENPRPRGLPVTERYADVRTSHHVPGACIPSTTPGKTLAVADASATL